MENANKWVQPTRFTGEYPTDWAGFTWLDFDSSSSAYHPGEDYNWGAGGDTDLGQDVFATSSGLVVHASKATTGYGNMVVIKHQLGYNMKRFIKELYGIETDQLYSLYAHLNDFFVKVGDKVETGQKIAAVGKTGTKWAHLHFEVYAPIGDLAKTDWRFYPTTKGGWTKEKIQQYYVPAYKFIEATKQMEDLVDSFLGKPKDYWLTVERDRESLLQQVGQKDKEWALKMEEQRKNHEIEIGTLNEQVLRLQEEAKTAKEQAEKVVTDFGKKETDYKKEIEDLKIRNSQLIDDNAENYKFWEAVQLVFSVIAKKVGGGKK